MKMCFNSHEYISNLFLKSGDSVRPLHVANKSFLMETGRHLAAMLKVAKINSTYPQATNSFQSS